MSEYRLSMESTILGLAVIPPIVTSTTSASSVYRPPFFSPPSLGMRATAAAATMMTMTTAMTAICFVFTLSTFQLDDSDN